MKKIYLFITIIIFSVCYLSAQINPVNSPYANDGNFIVVSDSNLSDLNSPILFFHPQTPGNYPVFIFQLGANGFGSSVINRHTYDIFMHNLASYGFVVIVIDDSQAGFPNGASFTATHDWFKTNVTDPGHWLNSYADPNQVIIGGHSNGGVNASALLVNRPAEISGIVFMDAYPSGGVLGIGAHDVSGYSGKTLTMTANENDPTANKDGWDKFTSSACKTFVNITGLDHGGFGDYVLANQPVGPIGRVNATATIRHFLVSWMLSEFKGDTQASNQLMTATNHPNTVEEFENDCGTLATGIANPTVDLDISIAPNPTKANINIITNQNDVTVTIFNATGQLVYQKELFNQKSIVDLKHLPQGIYIVKLTNTAINYSKVIVKN